MDSNAVIHQASSKEISNSQRLPGVIVTASKSTAQRDYPA